MSTTCFVISPFGDPFDEYYEKIYKPAIEKADLQAIRADEVYGTGAIIEDIFAQIVSARMVICEATGKNPNVNYELGVAHALQKPAIIVTQSIADVPFDYRHLRVITYDQKKVHWAEELQAAISKTILAVLSDPGRAMAWRPKTEQAEEITHDDFQGATLSYSPNPSIATLRYRNQFVLLGARAGDVHPGFKGFFQEIYEDIENLEAAISKSEYVQLRKIWHDDKNGCITIWVDLIHNLGETSTFTQEQLSEALHDGYGWYAHQGISVRARVLERNIWSDSFFPNAPEFYEDLPF